MAWVTDYEIEEKLWQIFGSRSDCEDAPEEEVARVEARLLARLQLQHERAEAAKEAADEDAMATSSRARAEQQFRGG